MCQMCRASFLVKGKNQRNFNKTSDSKKEKRPKKREKRKKMNELIFCAFLSF